MTGTTRRSVAPRLILIGLLVSVAGAATASHVVVDQQTRDPGSLPVVGTASISGVVEDDQQPAQPVRRAVVTLTGSGLHPSRGAITDDAGRFALGGLPAGRFTLTAERGGYVTTAYGARRPARPGTPIIVADGQRIPDLHVRLWRGAVLSGVLRDVSGTPLPNMAVAAVPTRQVTPVALTLSNNNQTRTDDRGEYRIFGLEPGTYVVRAANEGIARPEIATSEAEVDAMLAALAARARQAGTILPANPQRPDRAGTTSQIVSAAPIYYPGTPVPADAMPVALQAGQERSGLDFVVQRIRVATIRGAVVGPDGAPIPSAFIQLVAAARGASFATTGPVATPATSARADGTFELPLISPGDYRLLARGLLSSAGAGGAAAPGSMWWAEAPVVITGDDVDLGRLTLQRGMTFSGRIVLDDGATSAGPDVTTLRVQLQSDSLQVASSSSRGRGAPGPRFLLPAIVGADGTFVVTDLVPGTYRVTVTGDPIAGSSWWLRAAMVDGRDLLDVPLRINPGEEVRGVQLVLSDRRGELSGTLTTAAGDAFPEVFVLACPANPALRLPHSRRVQAVRPDSSGRFVFENLPAGDYLLFALTDIDDGQWNDPGFFDSMPGASVQLSLAHGEKKVQDLRVGKVE
jgi:hypothetical protein